MNTIEELALENLNRIYGFMYDDKTNQLYIEQMTSLKTLTIIIRNRIFNEQQILAILGIP